MAALQEKIEHALDENRILILGIQVLLGFQFESFFQQKFESLPDRSRIIMLAGLFFQLITLILLIAPVAFHRIVRSGEDTLDLHQFGTLLTGSALPPFALGMASSLYVAGERIGGLGIGVGAGVLTLCAALFLWYGLELALRSRDKKGLTSMKGQQEQRKATPLDKKIDRAFTETRIVLPGAQVLLGFQCLIILMRSFDTLPEGLRTLHMASFASVALSTILLMAPAAYHRIVEEGEDGERVHEFTSMMLLLSMGFLGVGISGDTTVVVARVTESLLPAIICGIIVLSISLGLWFGFMLLRRRTIKEQEAS